MHSSGRQSTLAPAVRASDIARRTFRAFPSQSSGVWFNTAAATLMGCMSVSSGCDGPVLEDQFGLEVEKPRLKADGIFVRIEQALRAGVQLLQLSLRAGTNVSQRR